MYSMASNPGRMLDAISLRVFADLHHRRFKGREVACAETPPLLLVVGDMLKVFDPRRLIEEVTHLSKVCA